MEVLVHELTTKIANLNGYEWKTKQNEVYQLVSCSFREVLLFYLSKNKKIAEHFNISQMETLSNIVNKKSIYSLSTDALTHTLRFLSFQEIIDGISQTSKEFHKLSKYPMAISNIKISQIQLITSNFNINEKLLFMKKISKIEYLHFDVNLSVRPNVKSLIDQQSFIKLQRIHGHKFDPFQQNPTKMPNIKSIVGVESYHINENVPLEVLDTHFLSIDQMKYVKNLKLLAYSIIRNPSIEFTQKFYHQFAKSQPNNLIVLLEKGLSQCVFTPCLIKLNMKSLISLHIDCHICDHIKKMKQKKSFYLNKLQNLCIDYWTTNWDKDENKSRIDFNLITPNLKTLSVRFVTFVCDGNTQEMENHFNTLISNMKITNLKRLYIKMIDCHVPSVYNVLNSVMYFLLTDNFVNIIEKSFAFIVFLKDITWLGDFNQISFTSGECKLLKHWKKFQTLCGSNKNDFNVHVDEAVEDISLTMQSEFLSTYFKTSTNPICLGQYGGDLEILLNSDTDEQEINQHARCSVCSFDDLRNYSK